ncbi:hypothetical protein CBR_g3392 [Chara braunii]|uniref:Uncharacterized protein n=1 Tax=Chara braunii TaxID=69332 RepID=A0A388JQP4_CHABU|nr:hypothetical protein CBR_g3392 [Chara braunii]|eukprot:GBG60149.1 hypothetical protein CBR_g3392 [Chara braunii]
MGGRDGRCEQRRERSGSGRESWDNVGGRKERGREVETGRNGGGRGRDEVGMGWESGGRDGRRVGTGKEREEEEIAMTSGWDSLPIAMRLGGRRLGCCARLCQLEGGMRGTTNLVEVDDIDDEIRRLYTLHEKRRRGKTPLAEVAAFRRPTFDMDGSVDDNARTRAECSRQANERRKKVPAGGGPDGILHFILNQRRTLEVGRPPTGSTEEDLRY